MTGERINPLKQARIDKLSVVFGMINEVDPNTVRKVINHIFWERRRGASGYNREAPECYQMLAELGNDHEKHRVVHMMLVRDLRRKLLLP